MAEKQVPLSIVLRTVDKATAGIRAINKRLDEATKPTRDLKKALGELADKSGFNAVTAGFRGVGSAVSDAFGKVLIGAGVVTAAALAMKSLIEGFDNLGDKAEALGVGVDFLASIRFAAERSGASVEALDSGFRTMATGLSLARAGTGKLAAFLKTLPPAFQRQVKGIKSNEEGFLLMANAVAKLPPSMRAAFSKKVFGDSELVPFLAKGAKGIGELQKRFAKLSPGMKAAAAAAGPFDDAMKDLDAATTGVKAALVTGLAPALTTVVEKLTAWLVDHRVDIAQWAKDIGEKLPGAVDKVVKAVTTAATDVKEFIDSIGGIKVAAIGAVAILAGPLLASVVTLGVGIVKLGLAARTATGLMGGLALAGLAFHRSDAENVVRKSPGVRQVINEERAKKGLPAISAEDLMGESRTVAAVVERAVASLNAARDQAAAKLTVEFMNAPKGTRVNAEPRGPAEVDFSVGYQMVGGS